MVSSFFLCFLLVVAVQSSHVKKKNNLFSGQYTSVIDIAAAYPRNNFPHTVFCSFACFSCLPRALGFSFFFLFSPLFFSFFLYRGPQLFFRSRWVSSARQCRSFLQLWTSLEVWLEAHFLLLTPSTLPNVEVAFCLLIRLSCCNSFATT